MNAPRFPRSPDLGKRPFDDGSNPFTDQESLSASPKSDSAAGAYVASAVDDHSAKRAVEYEAVLPNRSRPLVIIGSIGALLAGTSLVLALMAISSSDWVEAMFYGSPVSLTAIAFAIPAWMMSHGDMRAIRAGAMDPAARRGTRWAYWLGCLGTLIGLSPAFGGIAALIMTLFESF
jgi:hypothetical protein